LDPRALAPPLAPPPVAALRGVAKRLGRRPVLRDVSLELEPGRLVAIVGENGAGKSTLLKILVGLLRPDAGTVELSGRLGYCPQEPILQDNLTVLEHFRLFGAAYGLGGWREQAGALLERFRFGCHTNDLAGRISGGTRQKLNLCLALLHDPEVLVLDEPYAGFDHETFSRFWIAAAQLRARGAAVLVVTHLVEDERRFDAVHSLEDGVLR
jgi:ABC-2 type transport system ATP-binding protein